MTGKSFCHVERSRDISYCLFFRVTDSSSALGMTKKDAVRG